MTRSISAHSTLTIGIDLGDRKHHLCVLDATGEIVEESGDDAEGSANCAAAWESC